MSQANRRLAMLLAVMTIAAGLVGFVRAAGAFSIEFKGREVRRSLLALYDSRVERTPSDTRLHKLGEMPLNHLGYLLDYHDVNTPLPHPDAMSRYRGVVTWFLEDLRKPVDYLNWLDQVTVRGFRLVALGEMAPGNTAVTLPLQNRVFQRLGVRLGDFFTEVTHRAKVVSIDEDMIGFELKLNKVIPAFPEVEVRAQTTRAHITIDLPTVRGMLRTSPVVTSDAGGFTPHSFAVENDPNTSRMRWLLNPFQFFKLALGDERFPIPDVTTVSGRRLYFSHIDGDGWNNITEVDGYRQYQALSVEVVAREAIEPYPDLPVAVALIAGDVQPLLGGNAAGIPWARRLFALPQVEVASHTHTHPYHWESFEFYNRENELKLVQGYRPPEMPMRERLKAAMSAAAGKTYANARYDPFIAGSDDLPRTYLREPYNLDKEIAGALRFSEQFAPRGKRATLYQWSGNTAPFEAALAATRAAGVRNINGGDTRLDAEYPSVIYVPPISRSVGRERQIYAVNSNENTYTNNWTGPFGGQMMLEHTLRNTESPRRLKGFNLYYHMYSGEKPAALRAIKHFLDMARRSEVTPIDASHYAAIADDFFGVEIEQIDLFAWAIARRGMLQTMRLDEADRLAIDYAASKGVIGDNRVGSTIYATLDPAVERAVISLTSRQDAHGARPAPGRLLTLVHARWRLEQVVSAECRLSMRAQGYGPGDMTWRGEKNKAFRIRISREGTTLAEEIRWSNDAGVLDMSMPVNAIVPVDMTFQCHE